MLRIAAESGGLALTSAVLGAITAFGGLLACPPQAKFEECTRIVKASLVLGLTAGAPLGTWWGGKLTGGQGSLVGALLGAGAGLLPGAGLMAAAPDNDAGLACMALGIMVGALVGYEWSHHLKADRQSSEAGRSLQPKRAVFGNGAILSLGGHF